MRAGGQACVGKTPGEGQREDRRFSQNTIFRAYSTGRRHDDPHAAAVDLAPDGGPAGARVERELERAQHERAVNARNRANRRGRLRSEQRHLQTAILLQLEPVVGREHLGDRKADFLVAVIHAPPLRRSAVPRQVGGESGAGCLEERPVHQDAHCGGPGDQDQDGNGARDSARKGSEKFHAPGFAALAGFTRAL
jgi:hypothetical protein